MTETAATAAEKPYPDAAEMSRQQTVKNRSVNQLGVLHVKSFLG